MEVTIALWSVEVTKNVHDLWIGPHAYRDQTIAGIMAKDPGHLFLSDHPTHFFRLDYTAGYLLPIRQLVVIPTN